MRLTVFAYHFRIPWYGSHGTHVAEKYVHYGRNIAVHCEPDLKSRCGCTEDINKRSMRDSCIVELGLSIGMLNTCKTGEVRTRWSFLSHVYSRYI